MKKVFRKVFRENCELMVTLKDTLKLYRIVFEKVNFYEICQALIVMNILHKP